MRLEEIGLHNFGWFKDETIVLTGVQSAVVRGMNGTGKSTGFIDAPLAALFGHCRASLDELLYPGADEMRLSLTFQLNGQRYRVIRKRSLKTKAGKSDLELQLQNGDEWISVSGARMAETQQKIIDLLGADYELFTSTCFFLQGKADQFTQATSSERKSILAQILRLEQYALLKQAATRHCTIADAKHGEKQSQLAALDEEVSTILSLEARQAEINAVLADSTKAIEQLEQHQQDLTTKKATLAAELEQLQAIPQQIAELQTKQSTLLRDQTSKTTRRERAAKILSNRATIESKVKEEAFAKHTEFLLEQERKNLALDATDAGKALTELRVKLSDGLVLEKEILKAAGELDRQVRTYQADTDRILRDIESDERASGLLQQVPCGKELQGECQFTLQAVQAELRLPSLREFVGARHCTPGNEDKIAPEVFEQLTTLRARHAQWEQENHAADVQGLEERIRQIAIKQDDCETRRAVNRTTLTELTKFTVLLPELEAAEREVKSVDDDLAKVMDELNGVDQQLSRLQLRLEDRVRLTTDHSRLTAEWQQDSQYLMRLRTDGQTAIGRLKELELEIKRAQDAGRQAEQLRQECASLRVDGRHFQTLATAYAQIPVLILESSIPLLEDQTNRILEKISTTGMRIRIDTQKTLKSRDGLAETLDLVVRDFRGERRYELYSGAEKFKVDLAMRIGLSRLLASRAGARLETIVIDEGFGCLDPDGIIQLRESLGRLSDDIGLLLVITHVDALKDSFPSQLVVTSDSGGSHVELVA